MINSDIDFEFIHFLPPESLFSGGGHVALRVPYTLDGVSGVGLLDVAGGAMPTIGDNIVDFFDLQDQNKDIILRRVNDDAPEYYEIYYKVQYLDNVHLGFTSKVDIINYFTFIDLIYIPLANKKLEKMLFDGLAIVFGRYYSIYVDEEFLAPFLHQIYLFKFILFFLRSILITGIAIVIYESIAASRILVRRQRLNGAITVE